MQQTGSISSGPGIEDQGSSRPAASCDPAGGAVEGRRGTHCGRQGQARQSSGLPQGTRGFSIGTLPADYDIWDTKFMALVKG